MAQELNSPRIKLRHWQLDDLPNWISMNSDPITLKYFPRVFTENESRESFERIKSYIELREFGLWAAEERETGKFMGFSSSEIFSFTSKLNLPSLNVMRKIKLRARPELDFEHPKINEGDPTREHVVFST